MDTALLISVLFLALVFLFFGIHFFVDWQSRRLESRILDDIDMLRNSREKYQKSLRSFNRYASKEPFKSRIQNLENKLQKWQNIEIQILEEYKHLPGKFENLIYEYYRRIRYYFQLQALEQRCDELFAVEKSVKLSADNLNNTIPEIYRTVQDMHRKLQKCNDNFNMLNSYHANGTDFERATKKHSEITRAMQSLPHSLKKVQQNKSKITHDDIIKAFPVIDQQNKPLDELLKQTELWREQVSEYGKLAIKLATSTQDLSAQIKNMPANVEVSSAKDFLKTMEENVQQILNESRAPNVSQLGTSIRDPQSLVRRTESLIDELKQIAQDYQAAKDVMTDNVDKLDDLAGKMSSFTRLDRYPIAWEWSAKRQNELRRMVDANTVSSGVMSTEAIRKRLNAQQECRIEIEQLREYVTSLISLRENVVTLLAGNEQIFRDVWLMKASRIAAAAKPYHHADLSHKKFLDGMDAIVPELQTLKRDLKYALKDQTFQESELAGFSKTFLLKTYAQDLSHFNEWLILSEKELEVLNPLAEQLFADTVTTLKQLRQWEDILSEMRQNERVRAPTSLEYLIQSGDTLLDELQKHKKPMRELQHAIPRWEKECEVAGGDLWKNLYQQWKKLRDDLNAEVNEVESVAYCANELALQTSRKLIRQKVKRYPGWFSDAPHIFGEDAPKITNLLEVWAEMLQVRDLLFQTVREPLFSAFQPIKDDIASLEDSLNYLARMVGTEGYPDSDDIRRWRKLLEHQQVRLKNLRNKGKSVSRVKRKFSNIADDLDRLKQVIEPYKPRN